jgi:hypothetical protein
LRYRIQGAIITTSKGNYLTRENIMNINQVNQNKLNSTNAAIRISEQNDFNKGYLAAKNGMYCSDCPYDIDDIGPHDSWVSGWNLSIELEA